MSVDPNYYYQEGHIETAALLLPPDGFVSVTGPNRPDLNSNVPMLAKPGQAIGGSPDRGHQMPMLPPNGRAIGGVPDRGHQMPMRWPARDGLRRY